jgi:hypothetical protein
VEVLAVVVVVAVDTFHLGLLLERGVAERLVKVMLALTEILQGIIKLLTPTLAAVVVVQVKLDH